MREWLEDWWGAIALVVVGTLVLVMPAVLSQRCEDKKLVTKRTEAVRFKKLEQDHARLKERLRWCKPMKEKP